LIALVWVIETLVPTSARGAEFRVLDGRMTSGQGRAKLHQRV